jgi:hypothetical protein
LGSGQLNAHVEISPATIEDAAVAIAERDGLVLRFAGTAEDADDEAAGEPACWLILDPAWSPSADDRGDLVAVRQVTESVLSREDLFPATTRLLDEWAAQTGIAEALTVDGTSFWYRRRLWAWRWLHERLIWIGILDELARSRTITAVEIPPAEETALADVVRLFAARAAIQLRGAEDSPASAQDAEIVGELRDSMAADGVEAARGRARHPLIGSLRDLVRRTRLLPADRRRARIEARRAAMDRRAAAFASEGTRRLLVVADPATYQEVTTPTGRARMDPFLGPIVDRLAGTTLAPIVLELGTRAADDATWARTTGPAGGRVLTADVLARQFGAPDDGPVSAVAADRVAADLARREGRIEVGGLDLGPALLAGLERFARIILPARLREVARERRLLEALRPAALLTIDEYGRTEWLSAARQAGIPVVAVQHGIIHAWHPGYQHRTRPDVRAVPQRTYTFGEFERRLLLEGGEYRADEVVVGGSPRLDLVKASTPTAGDASALRAELGVAAGERLLVISTTFAEVFRRFYAPVAFASLVGRPIPGVRVVVKLHPGEKDGELYLRLLDGLRGPGEPARTDVSVVKRVDLYRLLAAADAHLGLYSTVLTEAVVTGTRNLLAATQAASDLLGYVAAGVAVPVRSPGDIAAAIEAPQSESDASARRAFLEDHFRAGPATERIADDLVAWLVPAATPGSHQREGRS